MTAADAQPPPKQPAPPVEPVPPEGWRVLSSGALAYRQPPTKAGRPVWLDALRRVKLCEHGHSTLVAGPGRAAPVDRARGWLDTPPSLPAETASLSLPLCTPQSRSMQSFTLPLLVALVHAAPWCDETMMHRYAQGFFDACESGKGWNATKPYVSTASAPFSAQVTDSLSGPKLSEVKTIQGYTGWMTGVVKEFGPKATVDVRARAVDLSSASVLYYAVFAGVSDYVYQLHFDEHCKIDAMHKIWNDGYVSKHPPQ